VKVCGRALDTPARPAKVSSSPSLSLALGTSPLSLFLRIARDIACIEEKLASLLDARIHAEFIELDQSR
jgi:hypothetical protein